MKTIKSSMLILFSLIAINSIAQSRTEIKGDRQIVVQNFESGIKSYESALKDAKPASKKRLNHKLAKVYSSIRQYDMAMQYYNALFDDGNANVVSVNEACDILNMLNRSDDQEGISKWSEVFNKNASMLSNQKYRNLQRSVIGIEVPVAFDTLDYVVSNAEFNTPYSEFWTTEVNDKYLIYISNGGSDSKDQAKSLFRGSQFYLYDKETKETKVYSEFPTIYQAGPATFYKGSEQMIYTDNNLKSGGGTFSTSSKAVKRNLQLVNASYKEKSQKWKLKDVVFKSNNQDISYSHPCLANNDKTLFFAANIPGGYGGADIYKVEYNSVTDSWGKPINLGPVVNSAGDELYPSIRDNRLYFTSDGHVGLGGYDIYFVNLTPSFKVKDKEVQNLPKPINSKFNDYAIFLNRDSKSGFFTSDRIGGKGSDDIYEYSTSLKVVKKDTINKTIVDTVTIITRDTVTITQNERDTLASIIRKKEFGNVYFGFDKYQLPEYSHTLEVILDMMNSDQYKNKRFLLLGSADQVGGSTYNLKLSEKRAQSVKNWLVKKGISPDRLIVKGRGSISLTDKEIRKMLGMKEADDIEAVMSDDELIRKSYREARRVTVKLFGENEVDE